MGFRINTNVTSLMSQRSLGVTNTAKQKSLVRLSSGMRINKAADDAAGLAISEKLKAQIRGLKQAERNANDGISMVQTAEGGLNEIQNILIRLRELSIQSASDSVGQDERKFANLEYQNLIQEVERIAQVSEFNGISLLNGDEGGDGKYEFQVGLNNDSFQDRISYDTRLVKATIDSDGLNIAGLNIVDQEQAQQTLKTLDDALTKVSGQRAELGAVQNRLTSTVTNLQTTNENLSIANSRIRDTDFAGESAESAKLSILNSAGTAVLAQANAQGQNALKLIG